MPKPVNRRKLVRKLRQLDFVGPFSGGRHRFMQRGNLRISIPNPHGKELGSALVADILREIGITAEEFENL